MKTVKKALALLLTLTIVLSLSITAFAAGTKVVNVINNKGTTGVSIDGMTFTAYKIFDLISNTGTDAATKYNYMINEAFGSLTFDGATGQALEEKLATLASDSAELQKFSKAVAEFAASNNVDAAKTEVTVSGETASFTDLEEGYYVIVGTAKVDGASADEILAVSAIVDNALDTPDDILLKVEAPKVTKTVAASQSNLGSNDHGTSADLGDVVEFTLTSTVPSFYGFEKYQFAFKDTLSENLKFRTDMMKAILGTGSILTVAMADSGADADVYVDIQGQTMTVNFGDKDPEKTDLYNALPLLKDHAGETITFSYFADVKAGASGTYEEFNDVYPVYSNDPDDWSKHTTPNVPHDKDYVYDFDLNILKQDEAEGHAALKGAQFALYRESGPAHEWYKESNGVIDWQRKSNLDERPSIGDDWVTIKETVEGGKLNSPFKGLPTGTYYLYEVKAPDGYKPMEQPVKVTITANSKENGQVDENSIKFTYENPNITENKGTVEDEKANGAYTGTIPVFNTSGTKLPETGGMGTTIFYTVGAVMMAGALVLLITRKKMSVN